MLDLCAVACQALLLLLQTLATIQKQNPCVVRLLVCKFVCRISHRISATACHWPRCFPSQAGALQMVYALSGAWLLDLRCCVAVGASIVFDPNFSCCSLLSLLRNPAGIYVTRAICLSDLCTAAFGQVGGALLTLGVQCWCPKRTPYARNIADTSVRSLSLTPGSRQTVSEAHPVR